MYERSLIRSALGALFRQHKDIPAKIRFWASIEITQSGCWEWLGTKIEKGKSKGYGYFYINNRNVRVIRWAYEYLLGPIPDGLELDHTCRNRICVNPYHTEPVTHKENCMRGLVKKSVCVRGHRLEHPNLYRKVTHGCDGFACRECALARSNARYQKLKEMNNYAGPVRSEPN